MPSTLSKAPLLASLKSFLRPIKRWPQSLFSEAVHAAEGFEVWVAEGLEKSTGQSLCLAYAGLERHKNYFFHMAFEPGYRETPSFKGSPAELEKSVASRFQDCGALFFEVDSTQEKKFPLKTQFKIPVWIRWEIKVREGWDELNKEKGMTQMRRLLNRNDFSYEITTEEKHFEDFYQNLYVPFTLKKHGDTAFVHGYEEGKAKFKSGELMLVKDGESLLGGIVLEYSLTRCIPTCICIHQNRMDLLQNGLLSAMLYKTFLRARERNYDVVDLGFTRAFLKDGVVRFKNRMGAALVDYHKKTGFITAKIIKVTPALRSFFASNPFIEAAEDHLRGVMFGEEAPETSGIDALRKDSFCTGLCSLDFYTFKKQAEPLVEIDCGRADLEKMRIISFDELA